jgi:hypothetical protein
VPGSVVPFLSQPALPLPLLRPRPRPRPRPRQRPYLCFKLFGRDWSSDVSYINPLLLPKERAEEEGHKWSQGMRILVVRTATADGGILSGYVAFSVFPSCYPARCSHLRLAPAPTFPGFHLLSFRPSSSLFPLLLLLSSSFLFPLQLRVKILTQRVRAHRLAASLPAGRRAAGTCGVDEMDRRALTTGRIQGVFFFVFVFVRRGRREEE